MATCAAPPATSPAQPCPGRTATWPSPGIATPSFARCAACTREMPLCCALWRASAATAWCRSMWCGRGYCSALPYPPRRAHPGDLFSLRLYWRRPRAVRGAGGAASGEHGWRSPRSLATAAPKQARSRGRGAGCGASGGLPAVVSGVARGEVRPFSGRSSSAKMAETGQTGTQAPQSMHSTGSIYSISSVAYSVRLFSGECNRQGRRRRRRCLWCRCRVLL